MALPGVASAHSGLSGSAKKETSENELLVVVNESANRTPDGAQDLFEKWIASMYGSSRKLEGCARAILTE